MTSLERYKSLFRSPSTRRAWIEILTAADMAVNLQVALHPEGVDRNATAFVR